MVKHLPVMWETQVQSLGQEDFLEKGRVTHSSTLAQKILWMEESDDLYSPWGHKESDTSGHIIYSKGIRVNFAFQCDEGRVGN